MKRMHLLLVLLIVPRIVNCQQINFESLVSYRAIKMKMVVSDIKEAGFHQDRYYKDEAQTILDTSSVFFSNSQKRSSKGEACFHFSNVGMNTQMVVGYTYENNSDEYFGQAMKSILFYGFNKQYSSRTQEEHATVYLFRRELCKYDGQDLEVTVRDEGWMPKYVYLFKPCVCP